MTIQQIEMCDRLAILGSFISAAESLGVTQPAVSSAITALEHELGVRLFIRSRRGVELTTKGKEILPLMRRMIGIGSEILAMTSESPNDRGSLRVAGRQGFMQYVFPELHRTLSEAYPEIHLSFVLSGGQSEIVEALATGRVDLAFGANPEMKSITAETIYRDPVLLCEKGTAGRGRKEESGRRYCLPTATDRLRKPLERLIRSLDKKPIIALESDDYTILGTLVASGEYIGPVYGHMLLDERFRSAVRPLRTHGAGVHRDLTILYRRDDRLPHVDTARALFVSRTRELLDRVLRTRN
ncbi:MAG: LysR family transcriptional regulator [Bacteroidetes bacterium]|nr:LysR family transcriptional regulator [Bacteroidota bacterium]